MGGVRSVSYVWRCDFTPHLLFSSCSVSLSLPYLLYRLFALQYSVSTLALPAHFVLECTLFHDILCFVFGFADRSYQRQLASHHQPSTQILRCEDEDLPMPSRDGRTDAMEDRCAGWDVML